MNVLTYLFLSSTVNLFDFRRKRTTEGGGTGNIIKHDNVILKNLCEERITTCKINNNFTRDQASGVIIVLLQQFCFVWTRN